MTTQFQPHRGFDWWLSFFARADWNPRRSSLETQLPAAARPQRKSEIRMSKSETNPKERNGNVRNGWRHLLTRCFEHYPI
jgi:hypothetical protein